MAFKQIGEYVDQRHHNPYPSEDQDPRLKIENEYTIQMGAAMMADFCSNVCELPYAFGKNKRTFKELHEYATGCYPNLKLKDSFIGKDPKKKGKDGKHITKTSISFDTLPVISKLYDVVREKNMRQVYDVDAICIDDDSIQAKEDDRAMLKYLVAEDTMEMMRRTKFMPNTHINPQALGLETEADVDLYFECGAYVFERELASIAACNKTKLISNYKVVQDGTFDDLIKYGIAFWKNEIDLTTNTVKIVKVDMYNPELDRCSCIIPYSQSNDFENLSRFGWIRTLTISDIRKKNPNLSAPQLVYLAQCFQNLNPEYANLINTCYTVEGNYNIDPLNRCKVLVLDYQWLGVDIENYVKNEGRHLYKAVDFDFALSNDMKRKGDRQIQKKVIKKFGAEWVIGTDILLKKGYADDIIYYGPDGDRCPALDYFGTKTGSISLVERSIGIQDDIDLANTKLRNAIASAVPAPRMVIQTGLMDNVFLNNIKQQPQDNMSTFRELGYLLVNAVDDDGKPIFTNQKLVDFLPMGVMEDVNVFTGQILAGINNLREVWGIAQGADGSTPQKYDGVGKTELAAQSSNAALFPTFNCYQYLFEAGFTDVVKKWQIIAKDRNLKVGYSPLGQKNMRILSLDGKFTNSDLNISLILGSTQAERQQLMQDITNLKALGIQTNFQQGITTAEFIYMSEAVKSGNIKEAMWVMAKIEKKKIAAQEAINAKNQEKNAEDQQDSSAMAEKNKQDTILIQAKEERKNIILKEAEGRKTAAVSAFVKDFAKEGGESAQPFYQKIMDDANAEIIAVLQQDNPQGPQGQPVMQPGQPPQGAPPDQQNMQQVA